MKKLITTLRIIVLLAFCTSVNAQTWVYPDIPVSISPENPGVCSTTGTGIVVTCNETYETYLWTLDSGETITGNPATLIKPGNWTLTVTINQNGVLCTKDFEFEVLDLSIDSEVLQYLENEGFYSIPIFYKDLPVLHDSEAIATTRTICTQFDEFNFDNSEEFIDLVSSNTIEDVLNNFRATKDLSSTYVLTENTCLCENEITEIEDDFHSEEAAIWLHQTRDSPSALTGRLYLRSQINNEIFSPINNEHKEFLINNHSDVLTTNPTLSEQVGVTLANTTMTNSVGKRGEPQVDNRPCGFPEGYMHLNHVFTSAGVPIRLPPEAHSPEFSVNAASGSFPGSLSAFSDNTATYRAHYFPRATGNVFSGYFDYKRAKFVDQVDQDCPHCYSLKAPENRFNIGYALPVYHDLPELDNTECNVKFVSGKINLHPDINLQTTSGGYNQPIIANVSSLGTYDNTYFIENLNVCLDLLPESVTDPTDENNVHFVNGNVIFDITDTNNEIRHIAAIPTNESYPNNGLTIYNYFEYKNGCWGAVDIENEDPQLLAEVAAFILEVTHYALDVIAVVPVLGTPIDLLNAGIYALEGDETNAAISMAGIVFEGAVMFKYGDEAYALAANGVKNGNVIEGVITKGIVTAYKSADGKIVELPLNLIAKNLEEIAAETGESFAELSAKFIDDITELGAQNQALQREFLDAFTENPDIIIAWKGLLNTSLRSDVSWLKRARKWLDEGAEFSTDGSGKLSKNGELILEIKNERILPNKYDYPITSGTPVGEVANGYQVVKNGNVLSVRRTPDESAYLNTPYYNKLTEHPNAHVLERHGHDVTNDALKKRATTGIAPDGASSGVPSYATKFHNEQAVKDAIDSVEPGTPAFLAREWKELKNAWVVEHPGNFGYGFKNTGDGIPKQMLKVEAWYDEVAPGVFQLITMFPNL